MIPNLPWGYQLRRDITSTRTLKGPRFFTILKSVGSDKKAWPDRIHHHLSQIHLFSVSAFSSICLFVLESSTPIFCEPVLACIPIWTLLLSIKESSPISHETLLFCYIDYD